MDYLIKNLTERKSQRTEATTGGWDLRASGGEGVRVWRTREFRAQTEVPEYSYNCKFCFSFCNFLLIIMLFLHKLLPFLILR
jgi:hypothetical protein